MRIFICDRCGHEEKWTKGITGAEFERQGFETLQTPYRAKGVVDVCAKCWREIDSAQIEVRKEQKRTKMERLKAVVGRKP